MKRGSQLVGLLLIASGVIFLLHNFRLFRLDMEYFWPLFLIIPGLCFEFGFFADRKNPGLLVPGGILLTYGALFYVNIFSGWRLMEYLWPIFPLGVAVGLLQLYWFGPREPGLLVPVGILGGFSLIALLFTTNSTWLGVVVPALLIAAGLYIVFGKKSGA